MLHNVLYVLVAVVRGCMRTKRATKHKHTLCEGMRGATLTVVASAGPANTQGLALQKTWWRDDCRQCVGG
jgi:hypothetical protein